MKNGNVVINKKTFELLLKKYYTRRKREETQGNYKTFSPAMKYYTALAGKIDIIRVDKACLFHPPETYFCVKSNHWNAKKTKKIETICIYPNDQHDRAARGLSDIIPAQTLREISWAEDFKKDRWVQNATIKNNRVEA